MSVARNAMERAALAAWWEWAVFAKHTFCHVCRRNRYCGAARRRGPWLCVDCFDVSPEAERRL